MCYVKIEFGRGKKRTRKVRIVPVLGLFTESAGTAPVSSVKRPPFVKGKTLMAFQMTDSQQVPLSAKFVDKRNQPAKVDGIPEWLTDNTDVLTLQPATDGLSCVVVAAGPLGTAMVTLKADADLGAGVVPLVGTFEVEITAGAATVVTITAGTPSETP